MWHVANGEENEPVLPREDNLSLSTEQTLQNPTKDKGVILEYFLTEMDDDVYGRLKRRGYEFKTEGINLIKTDLTVETRETTFPTYQDNKESIVGVLEPLLEKFNLGIMDKNKGYGKNDLTLIRKLGIKVSNLSKKDKEKFASQRTLFDYL
jgi:DNA polymerase IV (DinB-like DNA polymerase)